MAADMRFTAINIENVLGFEGATDTIEGNDQDNVLDGRGGLDRLYGNGGNDALSLYDGDYGNGGAGNDTYRIRHKARFSGNIVIEEHDAEEELSSVLLDYTISQIGLARLEASATGGFDVLIDLDNGDGTTSILELRGIYDADLKRTPKGFVFISKDGFYLIPQFSTNLADGADFDGRYAARYMADLDQSMPDGFTEEGLSLEVNVERGIVRKTGATTIEETLAAHFLLVAEGSTGDDLVIGNGESNVLRGYRGNDTLIGGGGGDIYVVNVDLSEVNDPTMTVDDYVSTDTGEKVIDNFDPGSAELDDNGDPVLDSDGNAVVSYEE
ncbi:MAG: hypothetical protein RLO21_09965, partial [Nitratireductor sp.]